MKKIILLLLILWPFPFSVFAVESDVSNSSVNVLSTIQENNEEKVLGTTEVTDTGVKEYFIVLFLCIIVAYSIMFAVKKKDLFKSI